MELKFSSSPLYDYFRSKEIEELPEDEKEALEPDHEVTPVFKKDIIYRLLNEKFFIIFITGKGGEGKSMIAKAIFKYCEKFLYKTGQGNKLLKKWTGRGAKKPKYDISKFSFTDSEFLDSTGTSQPLEINVKDENFEPFSQIGGKAEKERKRMLLSRIRALQINYILADPIFDDGKLSQLFTYKIFANDISFEAKKNRSVIYVQDYDFVWQPIGHIITSETIVPGYKEKKDKQLIEIKQMQQPDYKRKKLERIVNAMVYWKDKKTGKSDDIRNYTKNCWGGLIKRRLDEMSLGGQKAGTEIKEIKDSIDAYFPIKKKGVEKDG